MTIILSAIATPFMRVRLRSALILAVAATILMAAWPSSVAAQPGPFSDVPDDAYYATPVAELNEAGVFDGTALSEFMCPDGFCPPPSR